MTILENSEKMEQKDNQGLKGIIVAIPFIWAGMLIGISFLEAPLKFQAPNVTLAIGLGIGRLVFGTLNKVEIVFAVSLAVLYWMTNPPITLKVLLISILLILSIQSIWLLPILDARAEEIIEGIVPSQKSPHLYYVAGEAAKLLLLIVTGFKIFKWSVNSEKLRGVVS